MKTLVYHRKTERFTLLYALYRKSNGRQDVVHNLRDLASQEGLGFRAFKSVYDYLSRESLIRIQSLGENPMDSYYASLTESGLFAIEEVFRDENLETAYFPSYREMMQ